MTKLYYALLLGAILVPLTLVQKEDAVNCALDCKVYTTNQGSICIGKGEAGATLHGTADSCADCKPYITPNLRMCIAKEMMGATEPEE